MKNIRHIKKPEFEMTVNLSLRNLIKSCLTILILTGTFQATGQTFFIKENFSNASGTTPPTGWESIRLAGGAGAGFRFDNSTNLQVPYPLQAPFAVFDPTATPWQGTNQTVTLESPEIDFSGVSNLLLSVDQKFLAGSDATARIQTWADNVWSDVAIIKASTSGVETSTYDVSMFLAGKKSGRIRFMWSGKNEGHWMIDNVKLYAPASLDAGIASIDIPKDPFGEGQTDISVTLLNYGSTLLNNARIRWSVNGVSQPEYSWSGSMAFAQRKSNINIGQMNLRAGVSYLFKIWSEDPNGQFDENPANDTIVRTLIPSLCGTYTIGGSNPNFNTITRAVEFLHSAGIGCPVVMKIRDGVYSEQLELKVVRGSSSINTITFEGEKGDSANVLLTSASNITAYRYTLNLVGAQNVKFRNLKLSRQGDGGDYALYITGKSKNIEIRNCKFTNSGYSSSGISITDQSDSILIENNIFQGPGANAVSANIKGDLIFRNNYLQTSYYSVIGVTARMAVIENNVIDFTYYPINLNVSDSGYISRNTVRSSVTGINIAGTGDVIVDRNRIFYVDGAGLNVSVRRALITNNWIKSSLNIYHQISDGIRVSGGNNIRVWHNSVWLNASPKYARAISIDNGDTISVMANIFGNDDEGIAINLISRPRYLELDRNNYYAKRKILGSYLGKSISNFKDWKNETKTEDNGYWGPPGFESDTVLIPTLVYLNGTGVKDTSIIFDHLGETRDKNAPDIGASEFTPCPKDGVIEEIDKPVNPLIPGNVDISVIIRNNGLLPLTEATIRWSLDNGPYRDTIWKGSLASAKTTSFNIGTFQTRPLGGHTIKAFIIVDDDCNPENDTAKAGPFYPSICGKYTVGGTNPDFISLTEAGAALQNGGIGCPVSFEIRDGIYQEEMIINSIPGMKRDYTIHFYSESRDSSRVIIRGLPQRDKQEHTLYISEKGRYKFENLSFASPSTGNSLVVGGDGTSVEISNCKFQNTNSSGPHIYFINSCDSINIKQNYFNGYSHSCITSHSNPVGDISNNIFKSTGKNAISGSFSKLNIIQNKLDNLETAVSVSISDSGTIWKNEIVNAQNGISVSGAHTNIFENRINITKGWGIYCRTRQCDIKNNWIYNFQVGAEGPFGILVECQKANVFFNSVNLSFGNQDSRAMQVNGGDSIYINSNIFSINKDAHPMHIGGVPKNAFFDRNSYFSSRGKVAWMDNNSYSNIVDWRKILNVESNGFFGNPYFKSDTSSLPAQILLDGAGESNTDVKYDIDGTERSTPRPDIGAKEFDPCQTDIGLVSLTAPNEKLEIGKNDVRIVIQNNGKTVIKNANIHWSVNDSIQTITKWQGNLKTGETDSVMVGSFDFKPKIEYRIKVWAELTDPVGNCLTVNDTVISPKLYTKLCGRYTIGGSNPDFETLNLASNFLRVAGIGCPVIFSVREGTYDEKLRIDDVEGSSSINTITFESESGNPLKTIITGMKSSESDDNYTVFLNQTKNIRFRGLNFKRIDGNQDPSIITLNNTKDVRLQYMHFTNAAGGGKAVVVNGGDSIFVGNSEFKGYPEYGIIISSVGRTYITDNNFEQTAAGAISGTINVGSIHRNKITNSNFGISVSTQDTSAILGNNLYNVGNGILISGPGRHRVESNKIGFSNGNGIVASSTNKAIINNNWIYNIRPLSTNGILLSNNTNIRLLFNTINITGTNNNSSAISIEGGSNIEVLNNVFRNASGGYCMKLIDGYKNLTSDYNCYYAPLNNVGSLNDRIFTNLTLWGNLINGESNSIFINPFFRAWDYRPNHILLNDAGVTINPVKHDIDSTLRHPVSPDIGVKEFTPCNNDAGINEFTSPVLPMGAGKQDIKVVLQNQGLGTINSVRIHWSVNGAVQPSFDWTGTLPTRRNVEVQIGQMEFLAGPEWNILAWTSQPNGIADCNNNNDTTLLFVPGTANSVPYPPKANDTTVCIGNSVSLYAKGVGKIGWYTAPTGGTWLGGDSILRTPILTTTTTYYVQDSVLKASLARTPVKVTVFNPPPFDAVPDKIYSRADAYTLGIDTSLKGFNHRWSTGDSSASIQVKHTGGFRVNFSTPDGCRLTDSVFVQFPDTAILRIGNVIGSCIVPVDIPVTVGNFRRINRFMGELSWDTARLKFDTIKTTTSLGMQDKNFNKSSTTAGKLSFNWEETGTAWKSLPDSTVIFSVSLIPTTSVLGNIQINMSGDTSRISFYNDQPKRLSTAAINGSVNVTTCLMQIEGRVITPLDEGVVNVQVSLTGPESRQTMTKQDGSFALSATKGTYTLTPFKNNEKEKLNGISTLDLALIQSHVLLRQRLANPFKVIAADANQSGSVTTVDIMHLRRMLLRMDTSLPGNKTWAFVNADQTFVNPNMPFPFQQNKTLTDRFGKITHTFRAIKLGDVNYDRDPRLDRTYGTDTLKLHAVANKTAGAGVSVLINADAIQHLMGFQGTLAWDTTFMRLEKIAANPLQIGINEQTLSQGRLMFSWNDPQAEGIDMNQGTTLFELLFIRNNADKDIEVGLADDLLPREAFDAQFQRLHLTLTNAIFTDNTEGARSLRVYPNPAKDQINLEWNASENGPAIIRLLDIQGRIILQQRREVKSGMQKFRIDLDANMANGTYFIQTEQAGQTNTISWLRSN